MNMKKLLSIILSVLIIVSLFSTAIVNTNADTIENPNPQAAQIGSVQAIRNKLKLVWNDEFGGDIGCGAKKEALVTTNGTDENGNHTSDEVRATAKWIHERYRNDQPKTRNGQLQHYVIEDGRNSWTEDGVLHIRGQREENGYVDPITGKTYYWTADGLRSSYFDSETGQANLQAFRFGMLEARIYTVNGKALEDENGNPVLDKDGNIQQDPKYSQGLWNGFWTSGNPDMSKECAFNRNKDEKSTWPYCGEIDISEAYTNTSGYSTYNSTTHSTDKDENGIIITCGSKCKIKYDSNDKILITDTNDATLVSYDSATSSYVVAEGQESNYTVDENKAITIVSKSHIVKQDENGKIYISDLNDKTIVDTEGNCYGSSTKTTSQLHYRTGERFNGTLVTGVEVENKKTAGLGGGYTVSTGKAGQAMYGDTGYHTYGVYWTPTQLVYYYDDLIVGYHDITDPQYFQLRECPQYIFLTFPIGGSVPGNPNPALDWAEYLVDYVRVYQADDGYNTDENYQGSYGFPQLNDLDQPISYYDKVSQAYSDINIVGAYNSCEATSGTNNAAVYSVFTGKVCSIQNSKGVITTKDKFDEGKYDVYANGVAISGSRDYSFTVNDTGVGTELKLSDCAKDKYDREYVVGKSTYIGTVDIKNGAHNLEIEATETKSGTRNGYLLSFVLVKNDESTATVTVNEDTPLAAEETESTTEPTTSTTTQSYEGTNYNITVSQKEKHVSSREVTNDPNKEDITMVLVIGQSNATTGVGYPCELRAIANGNRDEVTEVTATPDANTVFMAKYGETITELNNSNDVKTLIENDHIGGFSSAMGKKWNELTGEKVVIVQAAKGARGMHEWVKDNTKYACVCGHNDTLYADAVSQFTTCYNALKENYNIKHSFYVWNQGEHDDNYYSKENVDINSKEKYYEAYKSMHEDLLADLPLDFGSINIARSHYSTNTKFLSVSRLGQYKAINTLKGCYMASRFFENTTASDMDTTAEGSYGIHATQKTYNAWGVDSAQNLYNIVSGNNENLESVELITNSGKNGVTKAQFNADGELTSGSDTLTADEVIAPAVQPFGDFKVTYSVNGDKSKVDAFGTPDASVFESGDYVKISVTKYNGVLQEEVETTTAVSKPTYHLKFNPNDCDFTYVENGISGYYNKQSSYEYYRADSIKTGNSVTFTTIPEIQAGKYKVNIEARTLESGRAIFDVSMTNQTAQLDTNTAFAAAKTFNLFDEITVSQTGQLDLDFNATSDGSIFLYRLNLICTELLDTNTDSTEPSSEITEPSSESTEPSSEPTEPSSEPTEPSSEPTESIDLTIDMTTLSGASIRLNNKTGLRFYTNVDKSKISTLRSNGYTVELGTLIAPYDLVRKQEINFDLPNSSYVDVKYLSEEYYTDDSGFSGIVGSIVNIKETTISNPTSGNIGRYFVARAYAKIIDEKGNTTVVYADYSMNAPRSLGFVAYILKNDSSQTAQELYQSYSSLIDKWALHYVDIIDPSKQDQW